MILILNARLKVKLSDLESVVILLLSTYIFTIMYVINRYGSEPEPLADVFQKMWPLLKAVFMQ